MSLHLVEGLVGEGAEMVGLLHRHLGHLPLRDVAELGGDGLEVVFFKPAEVRLS